MWCAPLSSRRPPPRLVLARLVVSGALRRRELLRLALERALAAQLSGNNLAIAALNPRQVEHDAFDEGVVRLLLLVLEPRRERLVP